MSAITADTLNLLNQIAQDSEGHYRFAAVGFDRKGVLVAGAPNVTKTHPAQARWAKRAGQPKRVSLHAEINTLIRARRDVDTLYVARIAKDGSYRASRPCPVCMLAIKESGVQNLVYFDGTEWVKVLVSGV